MSVETSEDPPWNSVGSPAGWSERPITTRMTTVPIPDLKNVHFNDDKTKVAYSSCVHRMIAGYNDDCLSISIDISTSSGLPRFRRKILSPKLCHEAQRYRSLGDIATGGWFDMESLPD